MNDKLQAIIDELMQENETNEGAIETANETIKQAKESIKNNIKKIAQLQAMMEV